MKLVKLTIMTVLLMLILLAPRSTSAHLVGQPPFLKINNEYANLYLVPTTSLPDFQLPQDGAPKSYLINQPINFELDQQRLPAPPEVVKKTKFLWDMGDGSKAQGLIVTHTYTKPGSYLIAINADDGSTPTPQLIESVLINVLPSADYHLPKAIIKINGEYHADPSNNVTKFPFSQTLTFDATASQATSSPIQSYLWDFGDNQSSSKPVDTHNYKSNLYQAYVILRIRDQNGLFTDNYIEVQDAELDKTQSINTPQVGPAQSKSKQLNFILVLGPLILLAGILIIFRRLRSHR